MSGQLLQGQGRRSASTGTPHTNTVESTVGQSMSTLDAIFPKEKRNPAFCYYEVDRALLKDAQNYAMVECNKKGDEYYEGTGDPIPVEKNLFFRDVLFADNELMDYVGERKYGRTDDDVKFLLLEHGERPRSRGSFDTVLGKYMHPIQEYDLKNYGHCFQEYVIDGEELFGAGVARLQSKDSNHQNEDYIFNKHHDKKAVGELVKFSLLQGHMAVLVLVACSVPWDQANKDSVYVDGPAYCQNETRAGVSLRKFLQWKQALDSESTIAEGLKTLEDGFQKDGGADRNYRILVFDLDDSRPSEDLDDSRPSKVPCMTFPAGVHEHATITFRAKLQRLLFVQNVLVTNSHRQAWRTQTQPLGPTDDDAKKRSWFGFLDKKNPRRSAEDEGNVCVQDQMAVNNKARLSEPASQQAEDEGSVGDELPTEDKDSARVQPTDEEANTPPSGSRPSHSFNSPKEPEAQKDQPDRQLKSFSESSGCIYSRSVLAEDLRIDKTGPGDHQAAAVDPSVGIETGASSSSSSSKRSGSEEPQEMDTVPIAESGDSDDKADSDRGTDEDGDSAAALTCGDNAAASTCGETPPVAQEEAVEKDPTEESGSALHATELVHTKVSLRQEEEEQKASSTDDSESVGDSFNSAPRKKKRKSGDEKSKEDQHTNEDMATSTSLTSKKNSVAESATSIPASCSHETERNKKRSGANLELSDPGKGLNKRKKTDGHAEHGLQSLANSTPASRLETQQEEEHEDNPPFPDENDNGVNDKESHQHQHQEENSTVPPEGDDIAAASSTAATGKKKNRRGKKRKRKTDQESKEEALPIPRNNNNAGYLRSGYTYQQLLEVKENPTDRNKLKTSTLNRKKELKRKIGRLQQELEKEPDALTARDAADKLANLQQEVDDLTELIAFLKVSDKFTEHPGRKTHPKSILSLGLIQNPAPIDVESESHDDYVAHNPGNPLVAVSPTSDLCVVDACNSMFGIEVWEKKEDNSKPGRTLYFSAKDLKDAAKEREMELAIAAVAAKRKDNAMFQFRTVGGRDSSKSQRKADPTEAIMNIHDLVHGKKEGVYVLSLNMEGVGHCVGYHAGSKPPYFADGNRRNADGKRGVLIRLDEKDLECDGETLDQRLYERFGWKGIKRIYQVFVKEEAVKTDKRLQDIFIGKANPRWDAATNTIKEAPVWEEQVNQQFHPRFETFWGGVPDARQNDGVHTFLEVTGKSVRSCLGDLGLPNKRKGGRACEDFHLKGICCDEGCKNIHTSKKLEDDAVNAVVGYLQQGLEVETCHWMSNAHVGKS